ncbi:MAG: DUF177 domain-containing protein [Clostridiales bacterium]|nr:DUF177 domain-containing protein [Clostridiales bacterium]
MILDMLPILCGEKNKIEFDFTYTPSDDGIIRASFEDIDFYKPIRVSGYVKSMADYMFLHEDVSLEYKTNCARCAEPVESGIAFSFEKDIATNDVSRDNDDYIFIEDKMLDLNAPLEDELLLELPIKTLCREDCKGLCAKCGKNLNFGECSCVTEKGDPRLAILKTLIK